jgi:hypothetical protein
MDREAWVHFRWDFGSDRPVVFGAHGTEESARLDCPADMIDPRDPEGEWVLEGVAPLGRDPFLLASVKEYVGLMRGLEA